MLKNLDIKRPIIKGSAQNVPNVSQYQSQDVIIAARLIDILFQYIDKRIANENNTLANWVWNILRNNTGMLKEWVRQGDVNILLDQFQEELDKRNIKK